MKIYISLPISGRDIEQVEASCIFAAGVIEKKGHTAVSPLDVSPDPDAPYSVHMGNDIAALLECDAVLFLDGWQESKGCQLEHRAAELYGKIIINGLNYIEIITSKDYKIGQIFQFGSIKLEVKKSKGDCKGCYFFRKDRSCPHNIQNGYSNLICVIGPNFIFKELE